MRKKLRLTFVLVLIFFIAPSLVSANEVEKEALNDVNEVSDFFIDFIDKAFDNVDEISVKDSSDADVTDQFIHDSITLINLNDYKSIQNMIIENDLSVSYSQTTYMEDSYELDEDEVSLLNIRGQNVSRQFYSIATDKKGKFTKEWRTTVSGSFSYNANTYKITDVSGSRITLTTANFGASFSPAIDSVSTSYSTSGSSVTFRANYDMRAVLGISIGSLPIGFNLDFGNHTHSFRAIAGVR